MLFANPTMYIPQLAAAVAVLIACTACGGWGQADAQYLEGLNRNKEIRICGPVLTNTLELVCQGRFNTMIKRSEDNARSIRDITNAERETFPLFPFRVKRNALTLGGRNNFRRKARNVADECCYLKSCTIEEISHYCEGN